MKFAAKRSCCFLLGTGALLLGAQGLSVASPAVPVLAEQGVESLAPMLKKTMPAIVNVSVQGEMPPAVVIPVGPNADSTPRETEPRKFSSIGSGVVFDVRHGYIITNAHVLKNAKMITVTLHDGRRVKAKTIGTDPLSDIAVLSISAPNLQTVPMSDSDSLQVGDFVVAIGNPFGLNLLGTGQSATFGIVSALQRSDLNIEGMESFIQTDAAINPGNSGGALVNMQGHLVGINTAIISPNGVGNIGIGFAIPINMARSVAEQIIKYGSVHRGMMGVFVQHLTPELAEAFGQPNEKGAIITQINPGSPAEKAGLQPGDIIHAINGVTIQEASQVKNIIGLLRVNSKVTLNLVRKGKPLTITADVTDIRQNEEAQLHNQPFLYGLALNALQQESPMHGHVEGVQIVGASELSPAWRAGLRPGDVIMSANQQDTHNVGELQKIATQSKDSLLVHVLRGPGALYVLVK